MNRRVLILAYFFPPVASAGTLRTFSFAKYLPQFGWDPIVITVKNDAHHIHDEEPLKTLPPSVRIIRTHYIELRHFKYRREQTMTPWDTGLVSHQLQQRRIEKLSRFLFPVDDLQGWFPFATASALLLARRERIDAILTSSPPETAHIVGATVHGITKLPWLADFRDEWVSDPYRQFPTPLHRSLNVKLERFIVKHATAVVSATQYITNDFQRRYPYQRSEKFITITNGFDYHPQLHTPLDPSVLTIVHAGSFAKSDGPDLFFEALRYCLDTGSIRRNAIHLLCVGAYGIAVPSDLAKIVTVLPFTPYHEMPQYFALADLLLLVISPRRGNAANTTKIFDYLASRKPIFAVVPPEGQAAQLIRDTKTGVVVAPNSITAIADELGKAFQQWQANRLTIVPDRQRIARYDRKRLTSDLARVLDNIAVRRTTA